MAGPQARFNSSLRATHRTHDRGAYRSRVGVVRAIAERGVSRAEGLEPTGLVFEVVGQDHRPRIAGLPQRPQDGEVAFVGCEVCGVVSVGVRSDQIGLSLPSPHASTCGMGIVHTLLTRGVTDSPARVVSELSSSRIRGIGVDEPYVLI